MVGKNLASVLLAVCLLAAAFGFKACSSSSTDRLVAALHALPAFVSSFNLPANVATPILTGIEETSRAAELFRDNPTRGNLRNVIAVLESLISRGVFKTGNASVDSRLGPAIALVLFIVNTISPPVVVADPLLARAGVDDSAVRVRITEDQDKTISDAVDQLERIIKQK